MPKTKEIERERGLYKNGRLWWMRVNTVPRSTGTDDLEIANRIIRMVRELAASEKTAHWLAPVVDGRVTLFELYEYRSAGTLNVLAESLREAQKDDEDADLDPWVQDWIETHLPAVDIGQRQRDEYARQVRALIPAGVRFPKSKFSEDTLKKALSSLVEPRSGRALTSSTRRRYAVAWKLFYRFARKRVPLDVNPFDDAEWIPANGSPRAMHWDHETTLAVLGKMEGEEKILMTLIFGTGAELGTGDASGVLKMEGRHVGPEPTDADELPWVVIPGSKNASREDRTVFVNRWAWDVIRAYADTVKPRELLWKTKDAGGKTLREAFYRAQVAAGVLKEPPRSERTGKLLWGESDPHTIHDARHTYCVVRLLGLDGEPRQSIKFCATQLGHADEQMVMRIYGKANISQRLRQLELREARKRAA